MIIHLDMDGVLADFETGFRRHTLRSIDSFNDSSEFWKFAEGFDHLYADLPMMPDARYLIENVRDIAREYGFQIEILTAIPSMNTMPYAAKDKEAWIKEYCPYGWKFKTGPYSVHKQFHAKPGDILIDDKIRNIEQWNAAGGIGIHHTSAASSVRQLRRILKGK